MTGQVLSPFSPLLPSRPSASPRFENTESRVAAEPSKTVLRETVGFMDGRLSFSLYQEGLCEVSRGVMWIAIANRICPVTCHDRSGAKKPGLRTGNRSSIRSRFGTCSYVTQDSFGRGQPNPMVGRGTTGGHFLECLWIGRFAVIFSCRCVVAKLDWLTAGRRCLKRHPNPIRCRNRF